MKILGMTYPAVMGSDYTTVIERLASEKRLRRRLQSAESCLT